MNLLKNFFSLVKKTPRIWVVLLLLLLCIKLLSFFPTLVEQWYSNGVYPYLSYIFRLLTGWLPFSVGDLLYGGFILYLIILLFRWILFNRSLTFNWNYWKKTILNLLLFSLLVYVSFNLFWGLNYNRKGVSHQFGYTDTSIQPEELLQTVSLLQSRVNKYYPLALKQRASLNQELMIFKEAMGAYDKLSKSQPFLHYAPPSVKSSLFGNLGNYIGYSGYYNPFSGEAQVNTTVPRFVLPYTTCHEIAHQLGYAKEQEANFIGFLAARSISNPNFRYAVYFELYLYARPYLHRQDSMALKKLDSLLLPGVKKDVRELKQFYLRFKTPVEAWVDAFYEQYLKANQQPDGHKSYGKVMIWLVEYLRKNGEEAL